MFSNKLSIYALFLMFPLTSAVYAGDFDWLDQLSIEAKADVSGFRAKLATRFNIGDVKVQAVINDIGNPSDAYMVMRLGEMSGKDIDTVVKEYKENRERHHRGWGVLAKDLGIKPGSKEFRALKRGDDMGDFSEYRNMHKKEKHGWKKKHDEDEYENEREHGHGHGHGKKWDD